MPENTTPRSCWFNKFFECLYLYIALAVTFHMVYTSFVPYRDNLDETFYIKLFLYTGGFIVLTALAYATYWHRKEKAPGFNWGIKHAWLQGIMRYFLAFEVSVYGFAKILQTQFATVYSRLDIPVGSLNGFELTWNYFGHSYTFAVILGCIQIGGGILLLFRRTTLAGMFTLLPVMVNIVFINIFYSIDAGAFINSLIITAGLTYLLMLRWSDLKILLFQKAGNLPMVKLTLIRPLLKVMCIGLAFFCIFNISSKFPSSGFEGKWKVTAITRNGKHYEPNEWLNNPRAWSNIYIEQFGYMEFSSNPYIFEEERAWRSAYQYNAFKKTFNIEFYNAPRTDTIKAKIRDYDGRTMHWDMMYYSDTMRMELIRVGK
ncbi:hypothetical protein [Mucilaginibacter dorajii]|uniref:DoxX family protein n=1 Tax=Mucilaginibacter dorajii TaxID=692994 RepID=A0ABP7PF78_9SPHI|nr:hypothetical protein [Mucilaginibacter dorajii]MCS3735359.1 hypothetical protein [Mucilaginibacter dorajii]